jgi:transposase
MDMSKIDDEKASKVIRATDATPTPKDGEASRDRWSDEEEYRRLVCFLRLGATREQLAEYYGVSVRTVYNWEASSPLFLQALREGGLDSDSNVVASLYRQATGYTKKRYVKIKSAKGIEEVVEVEEDVPPSTLACIYWLNNRQRDKWRRGARNPQDDSGPRGEETDQALRDALQKVLDKPAASQEASDKSDAKH